MENNTFAIRYHHQDHCMRNPDYKDLAIYKLNFYIKAGYYCDSLLICYPGQLDKNYKKRGAVAKLDYKVNTKTNTYLAKVCENKQKEYCNGKGIDSLCKLAKDVPSAFVPWHGIHIHRTADDKNITKLQLSIFPLKYSIGSEEYFSIKIGGVKDGLDTDIIVGRPFK
uniref:Uncharacterized protein n=1 Tax=Meloidogyne hapla TaxID=6305 RepID=A0A1I8BXV2_MELHA